MERKNKSLPPLVERIQAFLNTLRLKDQEIIIAAVSGGVDSVVMLHLLQQVRRTLPFQLQAAHLDHGLRGRESAQDARFVKNLCSQWEIPLVTESVDVAAYCRDHKCSVETGARQCRYDFFSRVRQQLNAGYVATAHNANDNAETILDRLLRGSGLRGLAGIPQIRDFYIRPLLNTERHEIESWARTHGLKWHMDATNADTLYKRNRIRHKLLPMLSKEFNPQIIATLNRTGTVLRQADELLKQQAQLAFSQCVREENKKKIVLDISVFLTYLLVLQFEMVRLALVKLGKVSHTGFDQFGNLELFLQKQKSGSEFELTPQIRATISGKELVIWCKQDPPQAITLTALTGSFSIWKRYILEIKESSKPLKLQSDKRVEWIDADKLNQPLCIRSMQPGDRFHPVNMKGSKKISDYLIDEKIPVHERESIPILESNGKIVWICGHRLDDRFKITNKTNHYLKLELRAV